MDDAQLFYRYDMHQLSKRCSRDVIIVNIKFSYPPILYNLDKLLCSNIFNLVVLEL